MMRLDWPKAETIPPHAYTCAHCGHPLASEKGWWGCDPHRGDPIAFVHICHFCTKPTFIDIDLAQYPSPSYGDTVVGVNDQSVAGLYEEARRTMSVASYTAAVLSCRKLLMHIAVEKGAERDKSFAHYVQYLAEKHYIPPDAIPWVDHIRDKGNEANHEIVIMSKGDAETLISFVAMLLKVIYEFPARVKGPNQAA